MLRLTKEIMDLVTRGALFVINHSGGKDSQAMFIYISKLVPKDQILVIHAHLEGVEWDGTSDHVKNTTGGYEQVTVRAKKTFFDMVLHRKMWPSPKNRQCTSDLKRGPIEKAIRHAVKGRDNKLVVNCMGMRAEESTGRSKLKIFKFNDRNSKAGREWYDWLPIHHLLEGEVFSAICEAGEEPHWAYSKGMGRLSCCFCIMASTQDLKTAAHLNPKLFKLYARTEREIDQTMMMPSKTYGRRFLDEIINQEVMI